MIVEMRIDTLKPLGVRAVEARAEAALPDRSKHSSLGGYFHTDVGILSQVIHLWQYKDIDERNRIRAAAGDIDVWPDNGRDYVISQETKILTPAPFSPPLKPRELGRVYEIRIYTYPPGSIPALIKEWEDLLPERLKYSPLVGVWYTDTSIACDWIHVWAYRNAGERERVREEVAKAGIWPRSVAAARQKTDLGVTALATRNMLVVPAKFSPLR